jgi:4-carboxymuconolactone decarboxylase
MSANKDLKTNNMDVPPHTEIYEQGYEMRKKVVGEEYVERSLKASGSDFMRPLQQFATVCPVCLFSTCLLLVTYLLR